MDSSFGQVFIGVCLVVLLSSARGHTCAPKGIRFRGIEGSNCDSGDRFVEILCGDPGQWSPISDDGEGHLSSSICSQAGCYGEGRGWGQTTGSVEIKYPFWKVNCPDGNEFSLEGCNFSHAKIPAKPVICNDGLHSSRVTIIIIDTVESVLFFLIIVLSAFLLHRFVLHKFKPASKQNDEPESQAMLPQSQPMVQVEKQPEKTEQKDTILGEAPEFFDNICYETTSEKVGHPSKQEPGEQEDTKSGEAPELVYNICYGELPEKEHHPCPTETAAEGREEVEENPELVYNVCYGTLNEKDEHPYQTETAVECGTELGENPELVYNVCYQSLDQKEQPEETEAAPGEGTEFEEDTGLVYNVCYQSLDQKEEQPEETETAPGEGTELEEDTELVYNVCYQSLTE